jgi:hypothetical protein
MIAGWKGVVAAWRSARWNAPAIPVRPGKGDRNSPMH